MRIWFFLSGFLLLLVTALAGLLGGLFLSFHLPGGETVAKGALALYGVLALASGVALFTRWRWRAVLAMALATAIPLGWFLMLTPSNDRNWQPSMARLATATLAGDILTIQNVRNFRWKTEFEATESWETRSYDLSKIKSVDLFMSYWAGPTIAHTIISFGFEDGQFLAWSIEVRYREGQIFSAVAGFFRTAEIITVAADERDVIQRRTSATGEDVYVYRLGMRPEMAREFLMAYVEDINRLAEQPAFYNTLTTNCTTVIIHLARAIGVPIPFDWRLVLTGHLPEFLYDKGALDTSLPFEQLRAASAISARGKAIGDVPDFSLRIREGLPRM